MVVGGGGGSLLRRLLFLRGGSSGFGASSGFSSGGGGSALATSVSSLGGSGASAASSSGGGTRSTATLSSGSGFAGCAGRSTSRAVPTDRCKATEAITPSPTRSFHFDISLSIDRSLQWPRGLQNQIAGSAGQAHRKGLPLLHIPRSLHRRLGKTWEKIHHICAFSCSDERIIYCRAARISNCLAGNRATIRTATQGSALRSVMPVASKWGC